MSNDLRKHIYANFDNKDTNELVEIWTTNDHVEWTELAFDVVKEIIEQRLGELPPQNEPVLKHLKNVVVGTNNNDLTLKMLADSVNSPEFYKPEDVLRVNLWLNRIAKVVVVFSILSNIPQICVLQQIFSYYLPNNKEWMSISWIIAVITGGLAITLQCFITYYALKALSSILSILMAMEFNSRVSK
jgi:hypothetical protein